MIVIQDKSGVFPRLASMCKILKLMVAEHPVTVT